ncbi:hypothetical protein Tco_0156033 [Tanacetum coccineum]
MTTLAEFMIVAGAENRPPVLDKAMYNSWESHECDVQATNIVLQDLPPDLHALVNHCQSTKDIWERVKLLVKGTELSYQQRECKLYNEFDKFTSVKGETLHEYYLRFAQLINDMHTIGMTMQQVQTNDLDTYDSDCDDKSSAKAVLMANLSNYCAHVLSELRETQNMIVQDTHSSAQQDAMIMSVFQQMSEQMSDHVTNWDKANQETKIVNESLTAELERYKEQVKTFEQRLNVDLSSREKLIDSQMDDMIRNRKHDVISVVDEEETLILKEDDFGKLFVPKKELSAEQAFWLQLSNPISEQPVVQSTPVKTEVPSELPKVSMVKACFQKLKNHLASFDKVVKVRTTPDAITEGP